MNAIFWFRRDLRLFDHKVLHEALTECDSVSPVFIFDPSILDHLQKNDHRVQFIFDSLKASFRYSLVNQLLFSSIWLRKTRFKEFTLVQIMNPMLEKEMAK
jgi:deoxyribodipyrimidine photolyase